MNELDPAGRQSRRANNSVTRSQAECAVLLSVREKHRRATNGYESKNVACTMLADRYRIVGLLRKGGMGEVYPQRPGTISNSTSCPSCVAINEK